MVTGFLKDITGQKFNRLTAIEYRGGSKWLFRCECGNEIVTKASLVKSGKTKSCGCWNKEISRRKMTAISTSHGVSRTPTYSRWRTMLNRCYLKADVGYPNYGGRGIKVCDRWRHSFENFLADMGEVPNRDYSLDRIDFNGDYTPENCRWATNQEQANNKRNNVLYTFFGRTQTLRQWCNELKADYEKAKGRQSHGITSFEGLFEPKNLRNRRVNYYDTAGNLIRTYDSQSDAARDLGLSPSLVSLYCKNKIKSRKKYNFEYADECSGLLPNTTESGELICGA